MKPGEKATAEMLSRVKDVWKKVDSGFYPEVDEEIKLINAMNKINNGNPEEGFQDLVSLHNELSLMLPATEISATA